MPPGSTKIFSERNIFRGLVGRKAQCPFDRRNRGKSQHARKSAGDRARRTSAAILAASIAHRLTSVIPPAFTQLSFERAFLSAACTLQKQVCDCMAGFSCSRPRWKLEDFGRVKRICESNWLVIRGGRGLGRLRGGRARNGIRTDIDGSCTGRSHVSNAA
jgi:hypothetical protein